MFLYTPKTDKQKESLILAYQTIIDHPVAGLINLIISEYHYKYYFIERHKENKIWNRILKWIDEFHPGVNIVILYMIVFGLCSYYALRWIPWMLRILINYNKIRQEAPIHLLELG